MIAFVTVLTVVVRLQFIKEAEFLLGLIYLDIIILKLRLGLGLDLILLNLLSHLKLLHQYRVLIHTCGRFHSSSYSHHSIT